MKVSVKLSYLVAGALLSCSTGGGHDGSQAIVNIEPEQFVAIDMSDKGVLVTDRSDILGVVSMIEMVNDSIIAICQNQANAHVVLYNINNGKSQIAMNRGDGPNEMLRVSTMSTTPEDDLLLVGMMDRKVVKVRWQEDAEAAYVDLVYRLPEDFLRGVANKDGGVIGLPGGHHEARLYVTNSLGETVDSVGQFPCVQLPDNVSPTNFMFQSDMALSPDGHHVVVACKSWNFIDIINTSTKQTKCMALTIDEPITLEKYEMGQAVSYNPKPFWLMFSGVDCSKESCYIGYIGAKIESPEDMQKNVRSILELSWDGTPKRQLLFDNDVIAFSVSKDGSKLYAVENAPDPTLYVYDLETVLQNVQKQ